MKMTLHFGKAVMVLVLMLFGGGTVVAQAPNFIAGWTMDFRVTDGTGDYPESGAFRYCIFNSGTSGRFFNLAEVNDGIGPFVYERLSSTQGRISYSDGYAYLLTFQTTNSGSFRLSHASVFGHQEGVFIAYASNAPAIFTHKIIQFSVGSGKPPFLTNGSYRLVTSTNPTYIAEITPGVTNSVGLWSYVRTNQSTAIFSFTSDTGPSNGFYALTFASPSNGVFLARLNRNPPNATNMQLGTFTLSDFVPPNFTLQPTNRSVVVGSATTFSAEVEGSLPLALQWYKDGAPIPGATAQTHSISSVALTHAGEYWLEARNTGKPVASARARLTPVCRYALPTAQASFGASGGASSFLVMATGDCDWSAAATTDWITLTAATNGMGWNLIHYTVAPNLTTASRLGFIHVSGTNFTVTQAGSLAPVSLVGKTLRLTLTNEGGTTITNISERLFAETTHTFRRMTAGATNAGTYLLSRTATNTATLWLTNSGINAPLQLVFHSLSTGSYTTTNTNGATQLGWFQLILAPPDFDGDAQAPDLLFQNENRSLAVWRMRGTHFLDANWLHAGTPPSEGWQAVATGDFNADGDTDILFQHDTGKLSSWLMQGTNFLCGTTLRNGTPVASGWRVVGVADFNHDGSADILFQHHRRMAAIWYLHGTTFLQAALLRNGVAAPIGWSIVSANDFNADGHTDLLWQNERGRLAVWHFLDGQFQEAVWWKTIPPMSPGWRVAGSSDFNFDGQVDLLWQHVNGKIAVWSMNHGQLLHSAAIRPHQSASREWQLFAPK